MTPPELESTLNPDSLTSGVLCCERNAAGVEQAISYFATTAEADAFQRGVAFGRENPIPGERKPSRLF